MCANGRFVCYPACTLAVDRAKEPDLLSNRGGVKPYSSTNRSQTSRDSFEDLTNILSIRCHESSFVTFPCDECETLTNRTAPNVFSEEAIRQQKRKKQNPLINSSAGPESGGLSILS